MAHLRPLVVHPDEPVAAIMISLQADLEWKLIVVAGRSLESDSLPQLRVNVG